MSQPRSPADEILESARALREAHPEAVPVAFWDFDGTLFDGDCCEGHPGGGPDAFPGLVESAIAAGHSPAWPAAGGFAPCWHEYCRLMETGGKMAAYPFFVRVFAGARADGLTGLARRRFCGDLRERFFPEALAWWRQLEAAGVRCLVISASADFFVKGAAEVLGVAADRLHGIRLQPAADGRLSGELQPPLTQEEGKVERLRELLAEMAAAEPGREFLPVAAVGNHAVSDGPMLDAVAATVLPAGRPVSVLVNAGDPPPASPWRRADFVRAERAA